MDQEFWTYAIRLAGAAALSLPVAWNRERDTHIMGLRTYPLIGLASCAYLLLAESVVSGDEARARILQGLMTDRNRVSGSRGPLSS